MIEWMPGTGAKKDAGEREGREGREGGREGGKENGIEEGELKRGSTRKGGGNGHHRSGAKQPSRRVSL